MAGPDELETRVTRLEHDVVQLRERVAETGSDAQAARVLASGADHDVSDVRSELRAHTRSLNALRETQREMFQAQEAFRVEQARTRAELTDFKAVVRQEFAEIRQGFAEMRGGMAHIVTLLGGPPPPG